MEETLFSFEEVYQAYRKACRLRHSKKCVLYFNRHLEENLFCILDVLNKGTYRHGPYREFCLYDSKKRVVKAAPFFDRVVHHVLCARIEPLFEKCFIYDSYVCRKGKGTHRALKRLRRFMYRVTCAHTRKAYYLKMDIVHYFQSIDHHLLYSMLARVISDKKVLSLLGTVIESSYDTKTKNGERGIPIGNLTSQLFANIYLDQLDHYIKERLCCRFYIRYMDDIIIFHTNKQILKHIRLLVSIFLSDNLFLRVHAKKAHIAPVILGIPFLGYITYPTRTRLRASSVRRYMHRCIAFLRMHADDIVVCSAYLLSSKASWKGYAKHANTKRLSDRIWKRIECAGSE